jgi:hypothetical protein
MRHILAAAVLAVAFYQPTAVAQETPPGIVSLYEALADTILSAKRAEAGFARVVLEWHRDAARADFERGDYQRAAANIALFANEGDNAIAGVRKRLVDGGHHHHASDEDTDAYDPGFVIVDKAHKASLLEVAAQMRRAQDTGAARDAWQRFDAAVEALLAAE